MAPSIPEGLIESLRGDAPERESPSFFLIFSEEWNVPFLDEEEGGVEPLGLLAVSRGGGGMTVGRPRGYDGGGRRKSSEIVPKLAC